MAHQQHCHVLTRIKWTCQGCRSQFQNHRGAAPFNHHVGRQLSTSPPRKADVHITAAPELGFNALPPVEKAAPARILPASPSYFTASPVFNDNILKLRNLVRRHEALPTVPADQAPRVAWMKLNQYRTQVGEPVTASTYSRVLVLLNRLNRIHPQLRPKELLVVMDDFRRPGSVGLKAPPKQNLDEHGRAKGIGRRKESSARVYLVEGQGQVLVNGKNIVQVFPRLHDRESALWPLKVTQRMDKYNVWALVEGGGVTGQAESITLALARALLVHEPALKPALRRAGTVTSDARHVERKKPGRLKARKKPAWVKR